MRVVIDTNVLISALIKADSSPAKIISLWRAGKIELALCPEIIEEIVRVLKYPKLQKHISDEEAARFLTLLHTATTIVRLDELVSVVDADPDDNKFVAVAVACQAEAIISGDGHLLEIGSYRDIPILTPAQFLDNVGQASGR